MKILLLFIICFIGYYFLFESFSNFIVIFFSFLFFLLSAVAFIFVLNKMIREENKEVSEVSLKIKKLLELNEFYDFRKVSKKKRRIVQKEYSRKSLDRVTASSVIRYHIENNIDSIRTDIENAVYNIELLEEYTKEVLKISEYESDNKSKYSLRKYRKIENRVFDGLVHREKDYLISVDLEVCYRSNSGYIDDRRYEKCSFKELVNVYREWQNGNKYEETKKQERKIMNDDIRYNVLKRDHYTCQICGLTAKDGAKLHVDHIIPVSKGGKTVMSNLQTLCDRCNLGKGNKMDDSNDMICPECGNQLVERKSKYGKFIGCSNYPKCHYKRQI